MALRPRAAAAPDGGGDAVGGEDDDAAFGHFVGLLDEDGALVFEGVDDVGVVDDFVADVDRGPVQFQGLLDGGDGAVDPGAAASGRGEQQAFAADS